MMSRVWVAPSAKVTNSLGNQSWMSFFFSFAYSYYYFIIFYMFNNVSSGLYELLCEKYSWKRFWKKVNMI